MSLLKEQFKKQGGFKLLNEYLRAGVLPYAFSQFLLTGSSQKSLEILRLGIQKKIHDRLRKKYIRILKQFDTDSRNLKQFSVSSNKVWLCWMQGLENAPALVQKCYDSIKANLPDREVFLITEQNRRDYIAIPDYIEEKYQKGIITHTHFSDLLRVALLCEYGGTWIDSTVFCSGSNIPKYFFDSPFFVFQNLKPGANGSVLNLSSWFMSSWSNQIIVLAVRELLWEYWKRNTHLIDYFLLHHFIMIVAEYYADEWKKIVQYPNSFPHVLLLMLFEPFNKEKWESITSACPFHKLTYKRREENMVSKGTYYEYIMNNGKI
ncbi:MAG: capsular polysaccharide synthesis protein [Bacteroidaceae bacterium]|nr:capsular polysaccharide synthesis protein [Bacteroidaceae bacterium]